MTIHRMVRDGRLAATREGGRNDLRIPSSAVRALLDARLGHTGEGRSASPPTGGVEEGHVLVTEGAHCGQWFRLFSSVSTLVALRFAAAAGVRADCAFVDLPLGEHAGPNDGNVIDAHVARVRRSLRELRPVLKPSGVVFVNAHEFWLGARGLVYGAGRPIPLRGKGRPRAEEPSVSVEPGFAFGVPHRLATAAVEAGWQLGGVVLWEATKAPYSRPVGLVPPSLHSLLVLSAGPAPLVFSEVLGGSGDVWAPTPHDRASGAADAVPSRLPPYVVRRGVEYASAPGGVVLDSRVTPGKLIALEAGRNLVGIRLGRGPVEVVDGVVLSEAAHGSKSP